MLLLPSPSAAHRSSPAGDGDALLQGTSAHQEFTGKNREREREGTKLSLAYHLWALCASAESW